jgi:hypothetical protein
MAADYLITFQNFKLFLEKDYFLVALLLFPCISWLPKQGASLKKLNSSTQPNDTLFKQGTV